MLKILMIDDHKNTAICELVVGRAICHKDLKCLKKNKTLKELDLTVREFLKDMKKEDNK